MKKTLHILIAAGIAVLVTGCASAPARFYTLSIAAAPPATAAHPCSVTVGPVIVPAAVDHPPITLQVAANRVSEDEFNRWAEPLNENIAQVVAGDLALQLGSTQVVATAVTGFKPDYQVSLDLQRFDSALGKSAIVEALWLIRATAGGTPLIGHTLATESVAGESYDALVAAHSRALATISGEIAAAIQQLTKALAESER